jgi:aspartate carbamoyltransferase catalytic subunit
VPPAASPQRPRALLGVGDLADHDIEGILRAVGQRLPRRDPFVVGELFVGPSLRTRVGFAVAAASLGGSAVDIQELRFDGNMSAAESFADTLRVVSGMVDVLVVRTPEAIEPHLPDPLPCPVVSGGSAEGHPTQALIDLAATEQERGPIGDLHVALVGDLGMRSARSLLELLDRRPPAALTLIAPPERSEHGVTLGPVLEARTTRRSHLDLVDIDVVHVVGLPQGSGTAELSVARRAAYALTEASLRTLPTGAVVLSPLPIVDEVSAEARRDPRVRFFEQSDRGVRVRAAVLDLLLGP